MSSTLPRVLEPEVMDTAEEAEAYDRMDHSVVNRALVQDFLALGPGPLVLDVGTGPAHVPALLAGAAAARRVVAVDAAGHMLAHGRRHVAASGVAGRVHLVLCDAKAMPFPDRAFDAVLSNSIVHHLPDPRPCFREIARVVKRGGAILLRDLHRPFDAHELERLVHEHAADADARQRQLFKDSLHAAFTVPEVEALLKDAGLGELEVGKTTDRHWTAVRRAR